MSQIYKFLLVAFAWQVKTQTRFKTIITFMTHDSNIIREKVLILTQNVNPKTRL